MKNYGKLNDTNAPSFYAALSQTNTAAGGSTTINNWTKWSTEQIDAAVAAAAAADEVILTVSDAHDEGQEGKDRSFIHLSDDQLQLCEAVLNATAKSPSKKVVLVLINGASISIDGLKDRFPAILQAGMPGTQR
jgi:hypothetical protein